MFGNTRANNAQRATEVARCALLALVLFVRSRWERARVWAETGLSPTVTPPATGTSVAPAPVATPGRRLGEELAEAQKLGTAPHGALFHLNSIEW